MNIRHALRVGLLGMTAIAGTMSNLNAGIFAKPHGYAGAQQSLPPDLANEVDRAQRRAGDGAAAVEMPQFVAAYVVEGALFLADENGLLYLVFEDAVYTAPLARLIGRVGQYYVAADRSNRRHIAIRVR